MFHVTKHSKETPSSCRAYFAAGRLQQSMVETDEIYGLKIGGAWFHSLSSEILLLWKLHLHL